MSVECRPDDAFALAAFRDVGEQLRARLGLSAGRTEELLLDPSSPLYEKGVERALVLVEEGGRTARVLAFTGVDFGRGSRFTGGVGFFLADDAEVGALALDAALEWLRARGCSEAVGPINFRTWFDYRAVTAGTERSPFLLEPQTAAHDAAAFERAGFGPYLQYATLDLPHLSTGLVEASYRRAIREGVRFECMSRRSKGEVLDLLFELSSSVFASKGGYTALSREAFGLLYRDADALIIPGFSQLAFASDGRPVGFLFAYPDLLALATTGEKRTVLKSLGVAKDAPGYLGWALCHEHIAAATPQGFERGLYALMEKSSTLLKYSRDPRVVGDNVGTVFREYALFSRALDVDGQPTESQGGSSSGNKACA